MPTYRFSHPIEVRYADLDPQRHVNNAVVLSYLEQARARYLEHLGLWDGVDFDAIGIIVAEVTVRYRAPIVYTDKLIVELGATRLGTKSLHLEYLVRRQDGGPLATGRSVLVAYDYGRGASIPIPDDWRRRIAEFEGLPADAPRRSANAAATGPDS